MVTPPLLLADTESSVNERLPFTSLELEAHWNVDCSATLSTIKQFTENPALIFKPEYHQLKPTFDGYLSALKKCAIIYNTPNTGRYSICVDYLSIHSQLNDLKSALFLTKERFHPDQIRSILGPLRNMLNSIHCEKNYH